MAVKNKPNYDYRSVDSNGSGEFLEYRPYSNGDNARNIDWRRFLKDRSLVLQSRERMVKPSVVLVADLSRSIVVGEKANAVRRIAGLLAWTILNNGLSLALSDGYSIIGKYYNVSQFNSYYQHLELMPEGKYSFASIKQKSVGFNDHVVVISDMLYSGGIAQLKANQRFWAAGCSVIALSSRQDREPQLRGNFRLADAQNNDLQDCFIDDGIIRKYQQYRKEYFAELQNFCLANGRTLYFLDEAADTLEVLRIIAGSGVLTI